MGSADALGEMAGIAANVQAAVISVCVFSWFVTLLVTDCVCGFLPTRLARLSCHPPRAFSAAQSRHDF
jgi:hypothetical protein